VFSVMSAWVLQVAYVPARGVSSFAVARREVHKSGVQKSPNKWCESEECCRHEMRRNECREGRKQVRSFNDAALKQQV
jgi:hypothetical protein